MVERLHEIRRGLHGAAAAGEDAADLARRLVFSRPGGSPPAHIAAYAGYADTTGTHLSGRVLSKQPGGGPLEHDTVWKNLINTWHRWESDEVADVEVTLAFQGHETQTVSDEEGYYQATLPPAVGDDSPWRTAEARVRCHSGVVSGVHPVLTPSSDATFGIISDLDDTVIHTGITSILLVAKLTFLENAKTRKPLDGVTEFYTALRHGTVGRPVNPIFYVSSSPWNLYDLLWDFIALNEIPQGPLLLRDFGLDRSKFIAEDGHGHKRDKALALLDGYPELPFVLIGDSGQEDAVIYAEVCELRPGRVRAVYIRDIDPDLHTARDVKVHRAMERAGDCGVPMVLAPDSEAMSLHASEIGLIPAAAVSEVIAEVRDDEELPETGEQALMDAARSVIPGV